jgi:conjugal transfer ATP-binding protein TraC
MNHDLSLSPALEKMNAVLENHSLGDFLPYVAYEDTFFYNQRGAGFVLETLPLVGAGEDVERQLRGLFQHTLPLGSNLQFLLIASHRIEEWLIPWEQARQGDNDVLQKLATQRTAYFRKLAFSTNTRQQTRVRTFRLIISYSQDQKPHTAFEKNQLRDLREQIRATFEGLGLPVKVWDAEDLIKRLDEILNISESLADSPVQWNPFEPLSNQIMRADTHLRVMPEGLLFNEGDLCLRTYSVQSYHLQWYLGNMDSFIGDLRDDFLTIPCDFMIHYGVHICDEKTLKSRMLAKCSQVERQAHTPFAKWIPSLKREAEEWGYVRHKFEEGQRLVRTRYQVVLISPSRHMSAAEQSLFNLYRANRWELCRDTCLHLPSLFSCLPMTWAEGSADDNRRFKKAKMTLSHEPANVLPMIDEWQGTQTPGMLLSGRRGQLFYWHPLDNNTGNYNCIVVGRSGAGKSVFMDEFISAILSQRGRVFILDVGRSYEKTVRLLGGEIIQFTRKAPLCINPFSAIHAEDTEEVEDSLTMLKSVLALMASPLGGVTDDEMTFIEKALQQAWLSEGRNATISIVASALLTMKDPIAHRVGERLHPYTSEGFYGRFFEGEATINLSHPLLLFEFEELKEKKDLQAVILQIVILQVTSQVYLGARSFTSALILDEAWDLLRGKQSGEFIETAARRMRKYDGSLITATQNINDFYRTPGAQAAFDNSDWMCLLSQKKESIAQLKQSGRLSLEAGMEELLKSVHTQQGQYSEVMIVGPTGYAIGRLLLDPFSNILYSTKAEDYTAVKYWEAQGLGLSEAIEKVAGERFHG